MSGRIRSDLVNDRLASLAAAMRRRGLTRAQIAARRGLTPQGASRILAGLDATYGLVREETDDGDVVFKVRA